MNAWLGPHVVPLDAYRRLMLERDWGKASAIWIFSVGFFCGEIAMVIAYWWGKAG